MADPRAPRGRAGPRHVRFQNGSPAALGPGDRASRHGRETSVGVGGDDVSREECVHLPYILFVIHISDTCVAGSSIVALELPAGAADGVQHGGGGASDSGDDAGRPGRV